MEGTSSKSKQLRNDFKLVENILGKNLLVRNVASEVRHIKGSRFLNVYFTNAFKIQQKNLNTPFKCKVQIGEER